MNKIYFTCTQNNLETATFSEINNISNTFNVIYGYKFNTDFPEWKSDTVNNFLPLLIVHDKIILNIWDFKLLFNAFSVEEVSILLNEKVIEIIADNCFNPAIKIEGNAYSTIWIENTGENKEADGGFYSIEKRLIKNYPKEKNNIKILVTIAEKNAISKNENYEDLLNQETIFDLSNNNLTELFDISTRDIKNINSNDIYKIMRLLNANKNLVYTNIFGADNLIAESGLKQIINSKLSPYLRNQNDSKKLFEEIINKKRLPNLGELYQKGIINLNDIIELRNNMHGKLFRTWFHSKDYDEKAVFAELLNRKSNKSKELLVKSLRFVIPKIIAMAEPVTGFITSVANSFLLDKIIKGWNPQIFLDDKLKQKIDHKISLHEMEERRNNIIKRFPNITRNDKCPCGSGKKFKKCCGK